LDFESETFVTHALRADSFDASEDGTGRGTPLIPIAFNNTGAGWWRDTDHAAGLRDMSAGGSREATIIAQTITAEMYRSGGATAGNNPGVRNVFPVMTLAIRGREGEPSLEVREDGIANAVLTPNGGRGGIGVGAIAMTLTSGGAGDRGRLDPLNTDLVVEDQMAVRRLTPRECERLQGFPDDYTLIRVGKKMASDGPRYKGLGNSMAVPVMRWIGQRIAMVDRL
jgi:DNA (cytosine-5)-methyltransferase 1